MSKMSGVFFAVTVCALVSSVAAKSHVFTGERKGEDVKFSFASYYGDHMVLQQAPKRAIVWGHAPVSDIGREVTVSIENVGSVYAIIMKGPTAGSAVWKAKLPAVSEHGPFRITATTSLSQLQLQDVLFGDVWVCSGQSNMQFSMIQVFNATEEMADTINYPKVRVFTVALNYSASPLTELIAVEEKWSLPSPATIGNSAAFSYFSAVCWLYGKYLHQTLGYPIGLVDTDWGGTPVEAWSSPDALAKCGMKDILYYKRPQEMITSTLGPSGHSVLWNAMIHPILNMTIYGAIWYQGEANAGYPVTYNCTFPNMIYDWRKKFNEGSVGETSAMFPFGFVQLAANERNESIIGGFPDIRWHQTADYGYVPNPKLPNVFMSVAMDLPDFTSPYGSIHPRDKQDVTERLALSGLSVAYNQPGIKFQGPQITSFYYDKGLATLILEYDNGETAISVRQSAGFEVCCSINSLDICGTLDPRWKPAYVTDHDIRSVTLSVQICYGMSIVGFRYAWRESPCAFKKCAVYSRDNALPAPPFIINGLIGIDIQTLKQIQAALG